MTPMLRRLDIRTTDKGDNVARFENRPCRLAPRRVRVSGLRLLFEPTGKIGARGANQRHEHGGESAAQVHDRCALRNHD